jgi:hypothetical protein
MASMPHNNPEAITVQRRGLGGLLIGKWSIDHRVKAIVDRAGSNTKRRRRNAAATSIAKKTAARDQSGSAADI